MAEKLSSLNSSSPLRETTAAAAPPPPPERPLRPELGEGRGLAPIRAPCGLPEGGGEGAGSRPLRRPIGRTRRPPPQEERGHRRPRPRRQPRRLGPAPPCGKERLTGSPTGRGEQSLPGRPPPASPSVPSHSASVPAAPPPGGAERGGGRPPRYQSSGGKMGSGPAAFWLRRGQPEDEGGVRKLPTLFPPPPPSGWAPSHPRNCLPSLGLQPCGPLAGDTIRAGPKAERGRPGPSTSSRGRHAGPARRRPCHHPRAAPGGRL
ncbi:proline-rich protein HaeIII subfamily 1-like [Heliangelus exortis]|uniref:proline-rich protein HaeIII subfamily 1-like n=1 Tax=Heliangelus exortis TaxID=472823 RepID=UPI003A8E5226